MDAACTTRPRLFVFFRNAVLSMLIGVFAVGWTPSGPDDLVYPVNMTLADDRLFVSDRFNGIHVFDVANPAEPQRTLRIPLNGNRGTAVRGHIVYANDVDKLLVIRVEDNSYEVIKEIELSDSPIAPPIPFEGGFEGNPGYGCGSCGSNFAASPSAPTGGGSSSSFATFTATGDYLYYLDYTSIVTLDISEPENPKEVLRTQIGWTVETLYPAGPLLFVGGTNGMYIFDRSNPAAPTQIGRVEHFRACDPVVVSGDVAYVTLRGGNQCGQSNDVLLCVDVEDPSNPTIIAQKELETPYGLTVRDPFLYVSNGKAGYKLLDVARPTEPKIVAGWPGWPTKDFIWAGDVLFVLGFDDLRVFDVSNPGEPVLLSVIERETL